MVRNPYICTSIASERSQYDRGIHSKMAACSDQSEQARGASNVGTTENMSLGQTANFQARCTTGTETGQDLLWNRCPNTYPAHDGSLIKFCRCLTPQRTCSGCSSTTGWGTKLGRRESCTRPVYCRAATSSCVPTWGPNICDQQSPNMEPPAHPSLSASLSRSLCRCILVTLVPLPEAALHPPSPYIPEGKSSTPCPPFGHLQLSVYRISETKPCCSPRPRSMRGFGHGCIYQTSESTLPSSTPRVGS